MLFLNATDGRLLKLSVIGQVERRRTAAIPLLRLGLLKPRSSGSGGSVGALETGIGLS